MQDKNDILIAWGSNSKKDIKTIKANLTSEIQGSFKYFYRNEKSNTPTHPSPYNNEKVKSFLKNENELKSFINLHADS